MKVAKTATVYVAATQKLQSNTAYFGICTTKHRARKLQEYAGTFQSTGRTETQLKALIHSLSLVEAAEEVILCSDSKVIDSFNDGSVGTWELSDWCKGNGKPIDHMELWCELSGLAESLNVTFQKAKSKKEIAPALKLMNGQKSKPEEFMALNLGSASESIDQVTSELSQDEADFIVKEIKKEDANGMSQEEADDLVEVAKVKASTTETKTPGRKKSTANETPVKTVATTSTSKTSQGLTLDIDAKTLKECESVFQELGLDTETAVKLFLKKSVRTKGIPFEISL